MKSGKFILDQPMDTIAGKVGKQVIITSTEAAKLKQFLPNDVQLLSHTAGQLRLIVPTAALKTFLRWLMAKQFTDISIEERELDDVFHELYAETKRRR